MKGKRVVIEDCNGVMYSGTIDSFHDWGTPSEPDRYIEFHHDLASAGETGAYGYVKEQIDDVRSIRIEG